MNQLCKDAVFSWGKKILECHHWFSILCDFEILNVIDFHLLQMPKFITKTIINSIVYSYSYTLLKRGLRLYEEQVNFNLKIEE